MGKNKYNLQFFFICAFTYNEPQLLFFFYNNNKNNNVQLYNRAMTAPFYLLSCCYVAPLMVIGDSLPVVVARLWIFTPLLFGIMRRSFLFILWLKENISPFMPPTFYEVTVVFQTKASSGRKCHYLPADVWGFSCLIMQSSEITTHLDPNGEVDWDNWIAEDYQIKIHWTARS